MVSAVPLLVNLPTLALSRDTLTLKIAVNIISAWRVLPANMVAQLAQFSKLVILMVAVTAKTQKMFPDGKENFHFLTLLLSALAHLIKCIILTLIYELILFSLTNRVCG